MFKKVDITKYEIRNKTTCDCGYEFTLKDVNGLVNIEQSGFYGNVIDAGSEVICPKCHKEVLLLLQQKGQTYEIIDTATPKVVNQSENDNRNDLSEDNQEFICPECKKVCKSQIGLNSHIKTHQK